MSAGHGGVRGADVAAPDVTHTPVIHRPANELMDLRGLHFTCILHHVGQVGAKSRIGDRYRSIDDRVLQGFCDVIIEGLLHYGSCTVES